MAIARAFITARVSSSLAAKWKYVNTSCAARRNGHSDSTGSFTLRIISALAHRSDALGTMVAPARSKASSPNPLPTPAARSTRTLCPSATSVSAPAGTSATRFSFALISFGTPMIIAGLPPRGSVRAEPDRGLTGGRVELMSDRRDLFRGDAVDFPQQLVDGAVRL